MPLEGLRAWIGEVERKLGMRTRVFLVLTVISIGIAGAAVYLAIDARDSSVSESDVQALQQELEAQIDAAATATAPVVPEEPVEPEPAPEAKPQAPKDGAAGGTGTGGGSGGGAEGSGDGGASAPGGTNSPKLQELLERAENESAEAEKEQAGK